MLGVFANYHYATLALDDLTLFAHGFNGRSYFHTVEPPLDIKSCFLLTSPGDPAMGQIIRRHLNSYLVTGQDLDKIHTKLAGNVGQDGVAIADVHIEHGVGQCIRHDALNLNYVVFCQVINLPGYCFAYPGLNKPGLSVIRC